MALEARIMSKFASYKEELEVKAVFEDNIYAAKDGIKKYIENFDDSDLDKFVIVDGELLYVGNDDEELEIVIKLGIGNIKSGWSKEIVEEIQNIVEYLGKIDGENIPSINELIESGESLNEENGYVGAPLVDRTEETVASGVWDIVDSYTSSNQLDKRYGTGFFFLDNNNIYKMNGIELSIVKPAILNYNEKNFIILGENMERWNKNSTLSGSDEGLLYNFDATMSPEKTSKVEEQILGEDVYHPILNEEIQEDVYWIGDVKTNNSRTALMLNCGDDNTSKEGGFVSVRVDNLDMMSGLTILFLGKVNEGYRIGKLHNAGWNDSCVALLQITGSDLTAFPRGRIYLDEAGGKGDLSNSGSLSDYKGLFYRIVGNGDFTPVDGRALPLNLGETMGIICSYRSELCADDIALCNQVGLNPTICSEFSFNGGEGFEHYIGLDESYQKNWAGLKEGYIDIGMVTTRVTNNRNYLSGEFYLIRVYQKSMTDEEMETEIMKATRYVNSFVETK